MRTIFAGGGAVVWALCTLITGSTATAQAPMNAARQAVEATRSYQTDLFGRTYRLDDPRDLAAYKRALETQLAQIALTEASGGATRQIFASIRGGRDRENFALAARHRLDKKMQGAMQEAQEIALALPTATGVERQRLLGDLSTLAATLRASTLRLLPKDMDAFTALAREGTLRHPPAGIGRSGRASDLWGSAEDPSLLDPLAPSTFWNRPQDITAEDLFTGFGRASLPAWDAEEICTYRGPKTGRGVHGGFEINCRRYKHARLKFGKQYSQPLAQRLFWALGFHTMPADNVAEVKVAWDERILTQFNSRQDEQFSVKLLGRLPVHTEHLQHYLDPFAPISAVIMTDAAGKKIVVTPQPDWKAFKAQLFKNPHGHPETVPGNFNEAFARRIQCLVYRHVNLQLKNETEQQQERVLGFWDWNAEETATLRETRGASFLAAWLNEFDPSVANTRLTMRCTQGEQGVERTFKHYLSDVGVCLGRADDATKMLEQEPNAFPWTFTRPAQAGERAIPYDGSYHPIKRNRTFEAADIDDARWMARLLAQLTQPQLTQALVASGMPSAYVRLYYNKLASRRNQALEDLGLRFPPLPLMDASRDFDYDPLKDGLVIITTREGATVSAPDEDWMIVKGRLTMRANPSERQGDSIVRTTKP